MQSQKQLQRAFRDHIVAQKPGTMITFNYVRQVTLYQMQAQVSDYMNRMQRCVLGRGWMTKDPIRRPWLIGVAEHLDTNSHVHAALIAPEAFIEFAVSPDAAALWTGVHKRCGQLHAERTANLEAMASYITKTLYQANSLDRAVYYTPQRSSGVMLGGGNIIMRAMR